MQKDVYCQQKTLLRREKNKKKTLGIKFWDPLDQNLLLVDFVCVKIFVTGQDSR